MKGRTTLALAAATALFAVGGLAHGQGTDMCKDMQGMTGMHHMPATVKAIDAKTGMVDVDAGGMALKLHFPSNALDGVKVGDKINVHMGFMKS